MSRIGRVGRGRRRPDLGRRTSAPGSAPPSGSTGRSSRARPPGSRASGRAATPAIRGRQPTKPTVSPCAALRDRQPEAPATCGPGPRPRSNASRPTGQPPAGPGRRRTSTPPRRRLPALGVLSGVAVIAVVIGATRPVRRLLNGAVDRALDANPSGSRRRRDPADAGPTPIAVAAGRRRLGRYRERRRLRV